MTSETPKAQAESSARTAVNFAGRKPSAIEGDLHSQRLLRRTACRLRLVSAAGDGGTRGENNCQDVWSVYSRLSVVLIRKEQTSFYFR